MMTKTFSWKTETGLDFEITIKDEMEITQKQNDLYDKKVSIVSARLNGNYFPTDDEGEIDQMTVEKARYQGQHLIIFRIRYEALEFVKKLLNMKNQSEVVNIKADHEFIVYYQQAVVTADAKIEKMKLAEKQRIEQLFNELKDNDLLEVRYHTSHGFSLLHYDLDKHDFFIEGLRLMKSQKVDILDEYKTYSDYGDYHVEHKYKLKFKILKDLIEKAKEKHDLERKQLHTEKKETEQRKADELFIFGTEILSSVGNLMLHSLGAKFDGEIIKIYTTGMTRFMKEIPHNTTYKIKNILREEGFKWSAEDTEWQIEDTEENRERTINLLKKYDTKVDPDKLNLQRCWECGNWHYPSDLDEDGYCGC
ncbi:MAG: hypothetical protein MI740_10575 [Halanaerobiales bacterium]|nr:hypothetical protein [Halanaerobiales bacterium]